MPAEERLADEAWRVDWTNECLWQGDAMVRLPPKAFAVLRLLMEQAGQLVTKEALLEAVWPEMAVSETVLTNCIGELRKVLGETAQAPRFIQTVHRRGYRFIGQLPTVTAPAPRPSAPVPSSSPAPPPLCVGRDEVLAHLHRWLAHVRQGARQVVFLTGEPGIGKTTVVNAFVAQAAAAGDVWLAQGQCIEHYGAGEAYLPVLEAVWPEIAVRETVLTNCIGDLRMVLGETAQAPRFIQTVHRRGYRFIGSLPTATPPAPPASSPALPRSLRPVSASSAKWRC